MKNNLVLAATLTVGACCALLAVVMSHHPQPTEVPQKSQTRVIATTTAPSPSPDPSPTVESSPLPSEPVTTSVEPAPPPTRSRSSSQAADNTPQKSRRAKPPIQDPTARTALSFVGFDPDADSYWCDAINDPSLPAEERKDLIEDLNEDGFSDPHDPGPQDVPLIVSRIELIEELAPFAMDQVNAEAFAEAYKDLVKMLNGQPVQ